eukprot:TRINITY_DN43547_c0_g1_i4.p1 TRINITY_DN43547_c0_g1~~TRINITY_DN43547_c0_g1_i4.p1  ORF type:complete len:253 (+),score=44.31 TRINITY_DN43547_c0_g1_i4:51-809(+)
MEVRVSGLAGPLCTVAVLRDGYVLDLKQAIGTATGIPVEEQRLFSSTRHLLSCDPLASLAADKRTLHINLVRRSPLCVEWLQIIQNLEAELDEAPEEVRGDQEVVLAALEVSGGRALCFATPELQADRQLGLFAVKQSQSGHLLKLLRNGLQADYEIVLEAMRTCGYALQYADPSLQDDPVIVSVAVGQNPWALEFVSERWKADRALVLGTVEQNGLVLKHADETLRADKEVVLAAVKENGMALQYVSRQLF